MKISSVMCIIVLSALAGCGNDNDPQPTEETASVSTATATPVVSTETQLASSEPISTEGAVSLNKDCNVEGIDGALFDAQALTIQRHGVHEISGWVVDADNRTIPQDLRLVVAGLGNTVGVWTNQAPTWIERKGVAQNRGYGPELNNSGFSFKVDTGKLAAGTYHVYVMSSATKRLLVCDPGRQLTLSP